MEKDKIMNKFNETNIRSIAKAISWRVILTVSHIVNTIIITGSLILGLKVAGLAAIINSLMYFAHERVWNYFQWKRENNAKLTFEERQSRSISKTVTWRLVIMGNNFLIPFILTGSWVVGAQYFTLATLVNMVLYWIHERTWNSVNWKKEIK